MNILLLTLQIKWKGTKWRHWEWNPMGSDSKGKQCPRCTSLGGHSGRDYSCEVLQGVFCYYKYKNWVQWTDETEARVPGPASQRDLTTGRVVAPIALCLMNSLHQVGNSFCYRGLCVRLVLFSVLNIHQWEYLEVIKHNDWPNLV
jgi:hypothetical protein